LQNLIWCQKCSILSEGIHRDATSSNSCWAKNWGDWISQILDIFAGKRESPILCIPYSNHSKGGKNVFASIEK
jgi:hypothetical protein